MGFLVCKECGMENEEDAEFCKNCGYKLDPTPITGDDKIDPNKSFLSKNSKIIVFSVAMIALLAVTAGFFMFMDEYAIFTQQNQLAFNKSHEQATPKAEWHKVANYTGIGNSYRSFNIKGAKFKIIINATPLMNYNTNSLKVEIKNISGVIGSGELKWSSRSALDSKQKTIKVTGSPGKYYLNVRTKDLRKWNVTIYDYY